MKNHKSFGKYIVHVYSFDIKGRGTCLFGKDFTIDLPLVEFSNFNYDSSTNVMDLEIKFNTSLDISKVEMPTWSSNNGQDDIIWYNAKKDINSVPYFDVPVSDF